MSRAVLLAVVGCFIGSAWSAKAGLVITISQSGPDVVANGVGSLNFLDLTFSAFDFGGPYVDASQGAVLLGPLGSSTDIYVGSISGPTTFGSGGHHAASSGTSTAPGNTGAGLVGTTEILVPGGYIAGNPFTVSSTWANSTIAGLGLTPGTYVWTWGSTHPDSLTVTVSGTAVPEPSTLMLFGIGCVVLAGYRRARRRAA
jgi:hypothetical protein